MCALSTNENPTHRRLGHPSQLPLDQTVNDTVTLGRTKSPLEVISCDLAHLNVGSSMRLNYVLFVKDQFTKFLVTCFIKEKSDVVTCLEKCVNWAHTQQSATESHPAYRVRRLHCDLGTENCGIKPFWRSRASTLSQLCKVIVESVVQSNQQSASYATLPASFSKVVR